MAKIKAEGDNELPTDLAAYKEAVPFPLDIVRAQIRGLPPGLLMCRMNHESILKAWAAESAGVRGIAEGKKLNDPEELVYRQQDGTLFLPNTMFFRMIMDAASMYSVKVKGSPRAVKATERLRGALRVWPTTGISLGTKDYTADVRAVGIKMGMRTMRKPLSRPCLPEWGATLYISVMRGNIPIDSEDSNVTALKTIVADGGLRKGVGAFRPERGGDFGTFVIESWDRV